MNLRIALTSLIVLTFTSPAFAAGVSVNPGEWEMTSTMTMSMLPEPKVRTYTQCIEEDQLDPSQLTMDEDNPCNISDVVMDDDSASWTINCPLQGDMMMAGQWNFTSSGETITGSGSMAVDAAGMKMELTMSWDGKRIGDCP